jgi:hypothetical protein
MLSSQTRTYGIEIEFTTAVHSRQTIANALVDAGVYAAVAGYSHNVTANWKIVIDASVMGGYELVSPILKGDAGIEELRNVCDVLNRLGCNVNRTCGLHVHHDIRDLEESAVVNLFKSYAKSEAGIDSMLPSSRRGAGPQHIKSLRNRGISAVSTMSALRHALDTRYVKLNLESYWRQGTVEFRHHSGSVDFEKISNWVYLTQRMVERSVAGEFGHSNFATMLNSLYSSVSSAPRSIMNKGIAKVAKACFESGVTDRVVVLSTILSAHPEAKTNLRRVTAYYKMWSENNNGAGITGNVENNPVIEYALARAAHFNPSLAVAA